MKFTKQRLIDSLELEVRKYKQGETMGFKDYNMKIEYESELLIEVIEYKFNDFSAIYLLDNLDNLIEDIYYNINTKMYTLAK